jgi:threonine/homoserine/homoserine lactone efflux protein
VLKGTRFMDIPVLARGLILGFSIAAVVGPIALLCLRRTLASGFAIGLASGLGAATADATYAAIASFGVSVVATLLVDQALWLRLVGGAFLVWLGWRSLRSVPPSMSAAARVSGLRLAGAYSSTLALTLSNPLTILSFAAVSAGLAAASAPLVLGVFVGSAAWWLVLAGVGVRMRTGFTRPRLRLVNVASGLLILAFGIQSLASATGVTWATGR